MCGIAGVLTNDGEPVTRECLTTMIHTLKHRGPDGYGYFESGSVGLAHARLSIIDIATGDQPIANEDQSVWTVFNGEIFNYIELRDQLKRVGHVFRTASDTEVIVHAYEEYGERFVEHLNGQFAIALWDSKTRKLILVRDRVGIRPLFYHRDGNRLLFGSEVKSLLAVTRQAVGFDYRGLSQVFALWTTIGETTVFGGVAAVPPGHMLICTEAGVSLHKYWDWLFPSADELYRGSFQDAADELRFLLEDAVRLQLRADVPVGAYLSGGLDSAIIASLIRRQSDMRLRTFSVTFEDSEFDESPYQQLMTSYLGTEHTSVACAKSDIAESFRAVIEHCETPIVRSGPVPLMLLSASVRNAGFKVVLSGEGADEIFAGYDVFKEAKIRRFWSRQPNSACRPRLFDRLYPYLQNSPVGTPAYTKSFFGKELADTGSPHYAHRQRWDTTARVFRFLSSDAAGLANSGVGEADLESVLPSQFSHWPGLSRDQYIEAKVLLSGYLLASQGDRVAMANSVECRVPFLDHRVVEFANRLPPSYKLRGLHEKAVLRQAMKDVLPAQVANRVKQPYRSPDSQAFFSDGRPTQLVESLLRPSRIADVGIFNPKAVSHLVAKCQSGRAIGFADNMAFMAILSTMLIHDLFLSK